MKFSDKKITSYAGIFIALCALVLSICEFRQSRRHDRLMLKPFLNFERNLELNSDQVGIFLINNGLRPAKIVDWIILVDDEKNKSKKYRGWPDALKAIGFVNEPWISTVKFYSNFILKSGDRWPLIWASGTNLDPEKRKKIENGVLKLNFIFCYESLLGDRFIEKSDFNNP